MFEAMLRRMGRVVASWVILVAWASRARPP